MIYAIVAVVLGVVTFLLPPDFQPLWAAIGWFFCGVTLTMWGSALEDLRSTLKRLEATRNLLAQKMK